MSKKDNQLSLVFKNRAFITLWLNQILVQIAYNMLNFSLIILVFRLTGSNTIAATFLLMAMIPAILFGVLAGVVADRFDKRSILLVTDLAIGATMFAFIPVQEKAVLILVVAFILNVVFQFFIPTEAATLPSIMPKEGLLVANSIFQFTPTAALIVGSSFAGPVVANFGYNPIFIFGGIAMFATFFLRRALPALPPEKQMAYEGKKEGLVRLLSLTKNHTVVGLKFILQDNKVWAAIAILSFIQAAGSTLAALGPGFMEQVLHIEATDSSLILLLPVGVGLGIGAFLTAHIGNRTSRRFMVARGLIIAGLGLTLMALTPVVGRTLAHEEFLVNHLRPFSKAFTVSGWISFFSFVMGIGAAMVVIPSQTSLQEHTPSHLRGRVFAVWAILTAFGVSIPALLAGAMADIFGVLISIGFIGVTVVTVGLLGLNAENVTTDYIPALIGKIRKKKQPFRGLLP